ncbi:MAG: CotH kinase family protein, partial [Planctomycetes bacterium]|nr:CotH kinase family protein [Planctomycetota bacterium]
IQNEMLVSDLFRRAGVAAPLEWTVNLTFNGTLDTRYVRKEHLNEDFLERYFGGASDGGNLYRAYDPEESAFPYQGDLSFLGEDPDDYRPYYVKRTNREEDDYSDVIELCRTFDPGETSDALFPGRAAEVVDVWQWARHMALMSAVSNRDGSLHNRTGEDYFLYRVPETSNRRDAGKWVLIPWDIEESFAETVAEHRDGDEPILNFIENDRAVDAVQRLFTLPQHIVLYYANLLDLRRGVFSRGELRQRLPLIDFLFGFSTIDGIEAYQAARIGFYDEGIPTSLSAGSTGAESTGCGVLLYTTASSIALEGRCHAALTRGVRVNGAAADLDAVHARWAHTLPVAPGESTIVIESEDDLGQVFDTLEIVVNRLASPLTSVSGTLAASTAWTAAQGPYLMTGSVTVPQGVTLTIEPGAVVFGAAGAAIIVQGRLEAAGTEADPILFRSRRCENRWGGIAFDATGTGAGAPTHLLRFCDIQDAVSPAGYAGVVAPVGSRLLVEQCEFSRLTANAIDGTDAYLEVRDSRFTAIREGVHCTDSDVIVTGSRFQGMMGDKDAIDFDGNGQSRSLIQGCTFLDGSDDGIDLVSASVDILDNTFVNIQDKAVSLLSNGPAGPPFVAGNFLYNCGTAIALKNGNPSVPMEGHHNTIVGNQEGLKLFAYMGSTVGGHGAYHSNIIWNNIRDVQLDARSSLVLTHSDVSSGAWPGEGNISSDPLFADLAALDVALRQGSPCIRTGRDSSDMGAVPYEGDLGFIRGDVDLSGGVDITDAIAAVNHLFLGGPGPICQDRMDSNDDGDLDVSDPIHTLLHLFAGGSPPPPPYPAPGPDPTPDGLFCP